MGLAGVPGQLAPDDWRERETVPNFVENAGGDTHRYVIWRRRGDGTAREPARPGAHCRGATDMRRSGCAGWREEAMPLEVIGAGFGRTGTNSLKLALERLGFGPCHHMHEVAAAPEQVPVWTAVAEGRRADWASVFAGYRSQVDWPGACYWRELAAAFPASKVILTVRPAEDWCRSFMATVARELASPPASADPVAVARRRMQREIIGQRVFKGRLTDRAHMIAVFRDHAAEVRRTIPADRLLVYEVAQGWAPLCAFLGAGIPDTPFPRTNTVREFYDGSWVRRREV
jgi:hypothetical protein